MASALAREHIYRDCDRDINISITCTYARGKSVPILQVLFVILLYMSHSVKSCPLASACCSCELARFQTDLGHKKSLLCYLTTLSQLYLPDVRISIQVDFVLLISMCCPCQTTAFQTGSARRSLCDFM